MGCPPIHRRRRMPASRPRRSMRRRRIPRRPATAAELAPCQFRSLRARPGEPDAAGAWPHADGYHEDSKAVVFADYGDRPLLHAPVVADAQRCNGERGRCRRRRSRLQGGARTRQRAYPILVLGAFHLEKNLPRSARLGGGSSDAAAALRLIAQADELALDNPHLQDATRATSAACLESRPRLMRGIGEQLSQPLPLPRLPAVLVIPGVALATKHVFAGWKTRARPAAPLDLTVLCDTGEFRSVAADAAGAAQSAQQLHCGR